MTGPEQWVPDALAAQAEHEKRSRSCLGQVGRPHVYRVFGRPARPEQVWVQCVTCGVTPTPTDYEIRREVRADLPVAPLMTPATLSTESTPEED